jgi:hypothetical protein
LTVSFSTLTTFGLSGVVSGLHAGFSPTIASTSQGGPLGLHLPLSRTVSLGLEVLKNILVSIKELKLQRSFTTSTSPVSSFKPSMQTSSHFFVMTWNLNGKPNSLAHLLSRHPCCSICWAG